MMMKKYILPLFIVAFTTVSCSEKISDSEEEGVGVEVTQISATIDSDIDIELPLTKASLVQLSDPSTTSIVNRGALGWKLDVQIYKSGSPYLTSNTYLYNSSNRWIPTPGITTYFPNYFSQQCEFTLYSVSPNADIVKDQTIADDMLLQDKLYIKTAMAPAHILNPTLKHANSMLDFTFEKVPFDIGSITVKLGSDIYTPYRVPLTSHYLLIIPPTTNVDPVVILNTVAGAQYQQTVDIIQNVNLGNRQKTDVNNRYIFTLIGYDLTLSPISILDWVSGGMVAGEYVAQTAYPTFRGPANTSCSLVFDNGLTQQLNFDSEGEITIRPNGRTITTINGNSYSVTLSQMIIDLTPYINVIP